MYKKFVIAAASAAVVLGAGGTALAVTGSDSSPAPSGTSSSTPGSSTAHAKGKGKHDRVRMDVRRLDHAVVVVDSKKGPVTHDYIHGTVTAVSATSIAVKSQDGTSMTFGVTSGTKVRERTKGKGAVSSIGTVKTGDTVYVSGTGATSLTAKAVVDVQK